MGLDNYPKPDPCKVLEEAGKLKIVRNEDGDVNCAATNCPFSRMPTGCWIRGKVFDKYVWECCKETLYEDKTRAELTAILQALKEEYKRRFLTEERIEDDYDYYHMQQLINYLETLLSIEEWDGKLIAWF